MATMMMITNIRGFDHARTAALSSLGVGSGGFKLGACILDKNRVVSVGFNQYKTHPKLAETTEWPCLHAETHALFKVGIENVQGMSLYVLRMGRDGLIKLAKPCEVCDHWIVQAQLASVYWSVSNNEYGSISYANQ